MKKPSAPLPPACPLCRPYGGRWRSVEGGLARCLCPRGEALAAGKVKRVSAGASGVPVGRRAGAGAENRGEAAAVKSGPNLPAPVHDGKRLAAGKDT